MFAVNNHSGFSRWDFIEIADPWDAENTIRTSASPGKGGLAPWRKTAWYRKKRHRHGACPPFPHGRHKAAGPDAAVFQVSAAKGDGIPAAADWLVERVKRGQNFR